MLGELFGNRYRILRKIGEGGMAFVYVANDEKLGRQVAIKILHQHMEKNADIRKRFQHEAHAISGLDHPNIVKIYDFSGEHSDKLWIVTELISGKNLAEIIETAPGGWLHHIISVCIVREICKALEKAHEHGIVHRDVKPENVMVTGEGFIKLMDFGIAKNQQKSNLTVTGTFMGSPSYMSPEQVRGRDMDHRCDIYSLGVLFYEIVTGRLPFIGQSTHDVVLKILGGEYTYPRFIMPLLPAKLDEVINRALAKEPDSRFQHIRDLAWELDRFLQGQGFDESHIELERCFRDPDAYSQRLSRSTHTTSQQVTQRITALVHQTTTSHQTLQKTGVIHQRVPQAPQRFVDPAVILAEQVRSHNQSALAKPITDVPSRQEVVFREATSPEPQPRRSESPIPPPPRISNEAPVYRPQRQVRPSPPRAQGRQRIVRRVITYSVVQTPKGSLSMVFVALLVMAGGWWIYRDLIPKISQVTVPNYIHNHKTTPKPIPHRPIVKTPVSVPNRPPALILRQPLPVADPTPYVETRQPLPFKPHTRIPVEPKTPASPIDKLPGQLPTPEATEPPKIKPPPASMARITPKPVDGVGAMAIASQPAAEIYLDGKRVGTTIDTSSGSRWIEAAAGSHTIELRRTGFETAQQTVEFRPGIHTRLKTVTLQKSQQQTAPTYRITIVCNQTPADVTITPVDGGSTRSFTLTEPNKVVALERGVYEVLVVWKDQRKSRHLDLTGASSQLTFVADFKPAEKDD